MLKEIFYGSVILTFGTVVYFSLLFFYYCWKLRDFRGPFALPIIGNCYTSALVNFLGFIAKSKKKYGKIFLFFGFTKPCLIVCDPIVARRILSDSKTFPKGVDYTYRFSYVFGQGLVTSNGDKHKKDRSIFGKYFIRSSVSKISKLINEITDHAINELIISKDAKPRAMNIEEFFARLALRTFMMFSIGSDYRNNPKRELELCKAVSAGSAAVARMIILGLPLYEFIPEVKAAGNCRREVMSDFHAIVNQRREQLARGEAQDVDDCLTAMLNEKMTETDMSDHFVSLICAGHDTTAYFASYLCYLLAQHPDVQEKLYQEVLTVLKGKEDITADDLTEMKYLSKVMQETLRFYAIIPNVTRRSVEEVHIKEANVTIPKDTDILVSMAVINRDPEIWENPSVFNPDRFEERGNEFTHARNGFFPFGYGTRTCIGNTLAQIESGIFICKLLRKVRFEPDPGFQLRIQSGISLTTSNGINVMVRQI